MTKATPRLRARKVVERTATVIELAGVVDDHAEAVLAETLRDLHGVIRLSFREVPFINSYGMMLLARHFQSLGRDHRIEFADCPEFVVDQFQMLDFARYGRIVSFYLRYFCDRCKSEELRLIVTETDVRRSPDGTLAAPPQPCACKAIMEPMDSLEFLAEHMKG